MKKFKTLKSYVYEYISEQISLGNLSPEEKISENAICQALDISRTPVREALIELAGEGILENIPRKGFIVRSLSEKEASEIYEVIGVLDGLAAALACPNLTEKDFQDMSFYAESMDLAISVENYDMYFKQQDAFHNIYIEKCGNDILAETLLQTKNKRLRKDYKVSNPEEKKKILFETNDEHKVMIEFFRKKDAKGIEEYMKSVHWDPSRASMDSFFLAD